MPGPAAQPPARPRPPIPGYSHDNEFLAGYLGGDTHPLKAWLVFEVAGVFAGALGSGLLAHRVVRTVERGPRISLAGGWRSRSSAA